jgi:hypothetical protein
VREKASMSLHQFILDNRSELIRRTRMKVATRPSPQPNEAEMEHGVPLFLSQLATALREEEKRDPAQNVEPSDVHNGNMARSATLHGQSLRKFGFSLEQVVHAYGDVCQAVTELADETSAVVTTTEFHTLNRCLDNAIAGAVTSWDEERDKSEAKGDGVFRRQLLDLIGTATVSFDALRDGRVGSSGATAAVLRHCLVAMRSLLDDPKWGTN